MKENFKNNSHNFNVPKYPQKQQRDVLQFMALKGDRSRDRIIMPIPLILEDQTVGYECLTDPIGASASFYDTAVAVQPV